MIDHDGTRAPAGSRGRPSRPAEEAFFSALAGPDAERLVANARCAMQVRRGAGRAVPVSVSRPGFEGRNSCIRSAYGAFVTYSLDELALIGDAGLRAVVGRLIRAFGLVTRAARVDRTVGLDDWLLSTHPLCGWTAAALTTLADALVRNYPAH